MSFGGGLVGFWAAIWLVGVAWAKCPKDAYARFALPENAREAAARDLADLDQRAANPPKFLIFTFKVRDHLPALRWRIESSTMTVEEKVAAIATLIRYADNDDIVVIDRARTGLARAVFQHSTTRTPKIIFSSAAVMGDPKLWEHELAHYRDYDDAIRRTMRYYGISRKEAIARGLTTSPALSRWFEDETSAERQYGIEMQLRAMSQYRPHWDDRLIKRLIGELVALNHPAADIAPSADFAAMHPLERARLRGRPPPEKLVPLVKNISYFTRTPLEFFTKLEEIYARDVRPGLAARSAAREKFWGAKFGQPYDSHLPMIRDLGRWWAKERLAAQPRDLRSEIDKVIGFVPTNPEFTDRGPQEILLNRERLPYPQHYAASKIVLEAALATADPDVRREIIDAAFPLGDGQERE